MEIELKAGAGICRDCSISSLIRLVKRENRQSAIWVRILLYYFIRVVLGVLHYAGAVCKRMDGCEE